MSPLSRSKLIPMTILSETVVVWLCSPAARFTATHCATNVMENINPNVPKVKFIAYNVTAALSELFF